MAKKHNWSARQLLYTYMFPYMQELNAMAIVVLTIAALKYLFVQKESTSERARTSESTSARTSEHTSERPRKRSRCFDTALTELLNVQSDWYVKVLLEDELNKIVQADRMDLRAWPASELGQWLESFDLGPSSQP